LEGNSVGIDATGLATGPNGWIGIILNGGANHNLIGVTTTAARKVAHLIRFVLSSLDGKAGLVLRFFLPSAEI
jgi:hypothetical protein